MSGRIALCAGVISMLICGIGRAADGPPEVPPNNTAEMKAARAESGAAPAYLGLSVVPLPSEMATQLGLQPGFGLLVQAVVPNSPAAIAGLSNGDIVRTLDDQEIIDEKQFETLVRSKKPGEMVSVGYMRNGKQVSASVKLAEQSGPRKEGIQEIEEQPTRSPWGMDIEGDTYVDAIAISSKTADGPISLVRFAGGEEFSASYPPYLLVLNVDGPDDIHLRVVEIETGKVVFHGPVNTDDQRAAIPADAREDFKALLEVQHAVDARQLQIGENDESTAYLLQKQLAAKSEYDLAPTPNITTGQFLVQQLQATPNSLYVDDHVETAAQSALQQLQPTAKAAATREANDAAKIASAIGNSRLVIWANKSHTFVLELAEGRPVHLLVKNPEGKTIFDGPVESAAQQDQIPIEVRDGFDLLSQHPEMGEDLLGH